MKKDEIEYYVKKLLKERKEEIEFVILFGSRARGDWLVGSDYDLFIGLSINDKRRLIERIIDFTSPDKNIEVFPYSKEEWERMFNEFHPLFLDVLEYGVVLWDRGSFKRLKDIFCRLRKSNKLLPFGCGWKINV
jgi:predicted nucleotidyltransferase